MPHSLVVSFSLLLLVLASSCRAPTVADVSTTEITTTNVMSGWSVNYPKQRKVFEIAGRLWLFYADGDDALYRTSLDGIAWSDPVSVRDTTTFGHRIAYWFDGSFLHYAHCNATAGDPVVYRRGIPHDDGSIEWPTAEQVVFTVPDDRSVMYPKVTVDSAGHPWVAFMEYTGGVGVAPYDAIVTTSSTADGTWQTGENFPFTLVSQNTTAYPDPVGVALGSGQTYWVYNRDVLDDVYYGRLWSNGAWGDEERATVTHSGYSLFNAVAEGDAVHLVFGGGGLNYRKRAANGVWGDEEPIARQASGHATIALAGPDDVSVTFLDEATNQVMNRERIGGQWNSGGVLVDENEQTLSNPELGINLNGLVDATGQFKIAAVYTTGADVPYHLKIAVKK